MNIVIFLLGNNHNIKILWFSGADVHEVEQMVEDHLKMLIIKHFDPKRADSIFTEAGEVE